MTNRFQPGRVAPGILALSALLTLGLAACSTDGDDLAEETSSGTDGSGWDSAGATGASSATSTSGDGSGSDSGGDPSGGGTTGADTGDTGEPDPEEESGGTTGEPMACDDETLVELFLSPDDSNSMSSPQQARDQVLGGWNGVYGVPLRTWEFLNYYTFDYPPAPQGELVITPSLLHDEDMEDGEYVLQIGVSSPVVADAERAPLNITLVLDESGSMSGSPIEMLKESCRAIAASLRDGDTISMVTWDTENAIVLGGYNVTGPNDPNLLQRIEELSAGGGTNLHGGLEAGYSLAQQVYDAERINRIVLMSDGGANVGITDETLIADHAGENNEDGIYMVGVGVGAMASYNDLLMDTVTDIGKGASVYIANEEEAWKVFNTNFVNTLAVAARDVQVKLDMPPGFEIVKFSGEEFSSDPTEVEPQHIAPNDAMVFHQTIRTCAPELATDDAEITVTANFKDAITFEEQTVTVTMTIGELLGADQTLLLKGAAVYGYAEALKSFRDEADTAALEEALAAVTRAEEALGAPDEDLAEIRTVLEAL